MVCVPPSPQRVSKTNLKAGVCPPSPRKGEYDELDENGVWSSPSPRGGSRTMFVENCVCVGEEYAWGNENKLMVEIRLHP